MRTVYQRMIGRNALRRFLPTRRTASPIVTSAIDESRRSIERAGAAEAVAQAMAQVQRRHFAPDTQRQLAIEDRALPIGCGQTMSQPTLVAMMLSLLDLPADRSATVLDVGSGSGYTSAILSLLARRVVAVERIPELENQARDRLQRLGYDNVDVLPADDETLGCIARAPYGGILVSAAAPVVPPSLVHQLDAGANMVIPVGSRRTQHLAIVSKHHEGNRHQVRYSCECRFVPLIGPEAWQPSPPDESDSESPPPTPAPN